MLLNALNIIYVLIAIAMTAFILLQRGAGATAGASFGAGASATVFGSRGSSSFLSRSTAVLATAFFVLSLGMGVYVSRGAYVADDIDLGVMGTAAPESDVPAPTTGPNTKVAPGAPATAPAARALPAADVPAPTASVRPAPDASAAIPAAAVPASTGSGAVGTPAPQTNDEPPR